MSTSKFANLHAGLLVRKGQATPAIASPLAYVSYNDAPPPQPEVQRNVNPHATSMAHIPEPSQEQTTTVQAMAAQALDTFNTIENEQLESPQPVPPAQPTTEDDNCLGDCPTYSLSQRPPRKPDSAKTSARVSVRITPEQRQLMKTVGAVLEWSQQRILSDALDSFLETLKTHEMDGCACFRKRLQAEQRTVN